MKDITHSGPVAQELALHKNATLFTDLGLITLTPLSMGIIKQATLGSTIVMDVINAGGGGFQIYTLNKATGAPNGSVARTLIDQLNFKRVGDCALLHFFLCQRLEFLIGINPIVVESDDTSVIGAVAILFDSIEASKRGGEAILEIRAVNVTPGAEIVSLFVTDENAFL
uniref:Uncharacterized protein n=1 Tax=Iridovirus LCIVAC01 TaxID=2506607 RepID=A0A481YQR2_9VIRU|nr:MAG: hypothetical protein LCIVAC01_01190 [Iridovirus LCIVAC01]